MKDTLDIASDLYPSMQAVDIHYLDADIAHAGIDVSDGLVQDCGHLCRAGGVGAVIESASVPLSPAARAADRLALCLTGGDDYELLLAVPPDREAALADAARHVGTAVTRIGGFRAGAPQVTVRAPDGTAMPLAVGGWSHFAAGPAAAPP